MNRFLSEESITRHSDYVRQKRLKYSIIESSVPLLKGSDIGDIYRMKIAPCDKRDAIGLMSEIRLHDVFFSSFGIPAYPRATTVASAYGNEANFLNLIYRKCLALPHGFVLIYLFGDRIEVRECTDFASAFYRHAPALAIDVCEHAYFTDYGFDRERYLISALPYLDLTRLSAT